jgi:predicted nucleic acid-binding protein
MTVICDASPLIFLAKLDRLALVRAVLGREVVVVDCVVSEILGGGTASDSEHRRLTEFVASCRVVTSRARASRSQRLSLCDTRTLAYAVKHRADWLLADERLMRRIAESEQIATIGTLGLLAAAVRRGKLTPHQARQDLDKLVSEHQFRISVALYQRFQEEIGGRG